MAGPAGARAGRAGGGRGTWAADYGGDDAAWERLEEDEHGRLREGGAAEAQRRRRRAARRAAAEAGVSGGGDGELRRVVRRGMIRFMHLGLDMSSATEQRDFRPTRLAAVGRCVDDFIREFFDQNPLSQMAVTAGREGVAERITDLSSAPDNHQECVRAGLRSGGAVSLQNVLEVALGALRHVPPYGHREVLLVSSSLSSCDPGDIGATIQGLKAAGIICSTVGLAAEVFVLKRLAEATGGRYAVAGDESQLRELLLEHAPAPPSLAEKAPASLVEMGFPKRAPRDAESLVGKECRLGTQAYICPRCQSCSQELPCECHVCGLSLVSSAHLARSYHHLFPPPAFEELEDGVGPPEGSECAGCSVGLRLPAPPPGRAAAAAAPGPGEGLVLRCPACRGLFCFDCDAFVREQLHFCPGCEQALPAAP